MQNKCNKRKNNRTPLKGTCRSSPHSARSSQNHSLKYAIMTSFIFIFIFIFIFMSNSTQQEEKKKLFSRKGNLKGLPLFPGSSYGKTDTARIKAKEKAKQRARKNKHKF